MGFIISLVIYAYTAYALQTIADKNGIENSWLAWIPVANIYLMCKIAGKPGWWLILFFIPLVNLVMLVIVWMEIAKVCNKESWWGILMIVPVVNLIVPGYLAFTE